MLKEEINYLKELTAKVILSQESVEEVLNRHISRYEKNFSYAHQYYNSVEETDSHFHEAMIEARIAEECLALLKHLKEELV